MNPSDALRSAILYAGREKIAETCEVGVNTVSLWRTTGVPKKHCDLIEKATDFRVFGYQLRPDAFSRGLIPFFVSWGNSNAS